MKKRLAIMFVIVFVMSFHSCDESNLSSIENHHRCIANFVDDDDPMFPVPRFHNHYHGYDKMDCVDGCYFYTNYYYKLLFRINNTYYVTKYAYSCKKDYSCKKNYDEDGPFYRVFYIVYVRADSHCRLMCYVLKNLIKKVSYSSIGTDTIYMSGHHITMLKKSEYDAWIHSHPRTSILYC